jgi:hypothetical protein
MFRCYSNSNNIESTLSVEFNLEKQIGWYASFLLEYLQLSK